MTSGTKKGNSDDYNTDELIAFVDWCPRRDSNPEPTDYESAALTVELQGLTILLECRAILAEMKTGAKVEGMQVA